MSDRSDMYFDRVCKNCRAAHEWFSRKCTSNTCCMILDESKIPQLILDDITPEEKERMIKELTIYKYNYGR